MANPLVLGYVNKRRVGVAHAMSATGKESLCGRTMAVKVKEAPWPIKSRYSPKKNPNLCRVCRRITGLPVVQVAN
jgi:hypothetical protein